MEIRTDWDWQVDERVVLDTISGSAGEYMWQEETYSSLDGESIAAVVRLDDGGFTVNENGTLWDDSYERVWFLRYSSDDSLTALVYDDEEWALSVDGSEWGFKSDYVWDTRFSQNNGSIAVAVQQDMQYGMALNGQVWSEFFDNANNFIVSPDGMSTAAVVQVSPIRQAELPEFQEGCYSVAVNGNPWPVKFTNVWTPVFDPNNSNRVAAQVRMGLYDYSIAVDGIVWEKTFKSVWEPVISPKDSSVIAPVREGGRWGLARDGEMIWDPAYYQLWNQQVSEDGERVVAIGAVRFGEWTVVDNNTPWQNRFNIMADLCQGNNGKTIAAAVSENNKWSVVVNDTPWSTWWDRVWAPVVSPTGPHVAVKVEKAGRYTIALDGICLNREFTRVWDPVFSPDGEKVLVRGLVDGKYLRIVMPVSLWPVM